LKLVIAIIIAVVLLFAMCPLLHADDGKTAEVELKVTVVQPSQPSTKEPRHYYVPPPSPSSHPTVYPSPTVYPPTFTYLPPTQVPPMGGGLGTGGIITLMIVGTALIISIIFLEKERKGEDA